MIKVAKILLRCTWILDQGTLFSIPRRRSCFSPFWLFTIEEASIAARKLQWKLHEDPQINHSSSYSRPTRMVNVAAISDVGDADDVVRGRDAANRDAVDVGVPFIGWPTHPRDRIRRTSPISPVTPGLLAAARSSLCEPGIVSHWAT